MIRRILFILALCAGLSVAVENSLNWNGWGDTIKMPTCSAAVTVYGRTPFSLTDFDMVRLVCQTNDDSSAGFADDSIHFRWGYQTFTLCLNSSGSYDTCYSPAVVVDTVKADTFGYMLPQRLDANGIAYTPGKQVDTLSCSGWAVQSRTFAPEWDVYARLWMQGITGMKTVSGVKTQFTVIRRLYRGARGR